MTKRIESPSSINTFKQCKRKYYYQYIEKLPTISNIHQVRGNIAHSTLESFFDLDSSNLTLENYAKSLRETAQNLFLYQWKNYHLKLDELKLTNDQLKFYFEETLLMIFNWVNHFILELKEFIDKKKCSPQQAFLELTPLREQELHSQSYSVHGFVDAIKKYDNEIHIIDYKTNSNFEFKESIKLQLAIYCLLYFEQYGKMPSKVGIFFLRHKLKMIKVDSGLMELAKREIQLIHTHTVSSEQQEDYPKTVSSLCKWSSGKCDFYEVCKPHG